eukprot:44112_1
MSQLSTVLLVIGSIISVLFAVVIINFNNSHSVDSISTIFANSGVCIELYDKNGTILFEKPFVGVYNNRTMSCLKIEMNQNGYHQLLSMKEEDITKAYLSDDINVLFDFDNLDVMEQQIFALFRAKSSIENQYWSTYLQQTVLWRMIPKFFGFINAKQHYKWMDAHYTASGQLIYDFLDDKYHLYSHGIGHKSDRNYRLQDAAENKLKYIYEASKLTNNSLVLDVGGGWGGLITYLAPRGVHVHTITIAQQSFDFLTKYVKQNGWEDLVTVQYINFWELNDNDLKEKYDLIACVGTIEHLPFYDKLLLKAYKLLKPGGYLSTDGFGNKDGELSSYVLKTYMFLGDGAPLSLPNYLNAWTLTDFLLKNIAMDTGDYFMTMLKWTQKFEMLMKNQTYKKINKISDVTERSFRMYMWGSTLAFKKETMQAYRVLLQKPDH